MRNILITIILIFTCLPALAENNCEWAVCESDHPENTDNDAAHDSKEWIVKPCTQADERYCSNDCSNTFSDDYTDCISRCISSRCSKEPAATSSERTTGIKEGLFCLETESEHCVRHCSDRTGAAQKTCRRACLMERCPDANGSEIIDESLSPGSVACTRCKVSEIARCRMVCGTGVVYPPGQHSGLVTLGCEQACVYGACAKSCLTP